VGERMLLSGLVQAFQAEGTMRRPERGKFKVFDKVGEKLARLQTISEGALEGDGVRELAGARSCGALGTW